MLLVMNTRTDDPVTTVKVPRSLRERIARDAAFTGQTAAAFLTDAVERWEREQRFESVRKAYSRTDAGYVAESMEWDSTSTDGLDD